MGLQRESKEEVESVKLVLVYVQEVQANNTIFKGFILTVVHMKCMQNDPPAENVIAFTLTVSLLAPVRSMLVNDSKYSLNGCRFCTMKCCLDVRKTPSLG